MTTIHHSSPPGVTPFAIYEDPDDNEPPSPSMVYDEGTSFNSEPSLPTEDDILPSIEPEDEDNLSDEPRPYRSSYTARPASRRISAMTATSFISSLPSEISISTKPAPATHVGDSRYTPRKDRPPFRNPSSVRAMQMASPQPLPAYEIPRDRMKSTYKPATPSRSGRSEDPSSTSGSRRHRRESYGHPHQSPRATPTPQHLPLVLLHVTIIPMQLPYSPELMAKVMPEWLMENYKLLEEKLQDIVLMRRGLLISHPRDEYDLLEERILESLELKTPRLLKCGHFVAPEVAEDSGEEDDEGESVADDATGRGSRMSGGTLTEDGEWKYPTPQADHDNFCTECHRHVKRPGKGVGKGARKWDLKIFAANGLMRAGAWSAAWSEMERCDVEIFPWIPEDVRKTLDKKVIDQQEREKQKRLYEAEVLRRVEEEAVRLRKLEEEAEEKKRAEAAELQKTIEAAAHQKMMEEQAAAERKLFDDALNEMIEEAKESIRLEFEAQALQEAESVAERFRALEEALKKEQSRNSTQPSTPTLDASCMDIHMRSSSRRRQPTVEIPLSTLLTNYFVVIASDKRNLAIVAMGALVVYLSMHMNIASGMQLSSLSLPRMHLDDQAPVSISTAVVTTTATSIETLVSTVTVMQPPNSVHIDQGTPVPSPAAPILEPAESVIAPSSVYNDQGTHVPSSAAPTPEPAESALPPNSVHSDQGTHVPSSVTPILEPVESALPPDSEDFATALDAEPSEAAVESTLEEVLEEVHADTASLAAEIVLTTLESSLPSDEESSTTFMGVEVHDASAAATADDELQQSTESSPLPLSSTEITPPSEEPVIDLNDASPNLSDAALLHPESPELGQVEQAAPDAQEPAQVMLSMHGDEL